MDFALLMILALIATGVIWAVDRLLIAPGRGRRALALSQDGASPEAIEAARKEPLLVEYARAFFPVILAVFLLRSFLVEPFRIPSGSMLPSLLPGDFILVNKFSYGIRLPVINEKIIDTAVPKRGDVMVFRYPGDKSLNYIKRVIGLPGDHVLYRDKTLYINGEAMKQVEDEAYALYEIGGDARFEKRAEHLDGVIHEILVAAGGPHGYIDAGVPGQYYENVIPPGEYFVMGDNHDRSNDSRYWGLVPEENLVGKAFFIWFSWDLGNEEGWFWQRILWNRIGSAIN